VTAVAYHVLLYQGRVQHEMQNVVRTKNVQQVLSVIKHALFTAIVNREGTDSNSDVNIMLSTVHTSSSSRSSSDNGAATGDSSASIENGLLANKLTALIHNKDIDEALKVSIYIHQH
jgi:hypothetical protein